MTIKNNYWKVILNKTPRYMYGYPGGWEIRIAPYQDMDYRTNKTVTRIRFDVPKGCPKESRANFKNQYDMQKRIAQSVTTEKEYISLLKRIDEGDYDYILKNDLKDEALIYWANNTLTADEYCRLLRYN